MDNKENILKSLQKYKTWLSEEMDRVDKSLELWTLPGSGVPLSEGILPITLIDYPHSGKRRDKMIFLEKKYGRVWTLEKMKKLIKEAEGEKAEETIKFLLQTIDYSKKSKKLRIVTYGGQKQFRFHAFSDEYFERNSEGKFILKPEHYPLESELIGLSTEQKNNPEITF
jgi:hypothetical protein